MAVAAVTTAPDSKQYSRTTRRDVTRSMRVEDLPEYLTAKEVAEYLGICRHTVYAMMKDGSLPVRRFGEKLVYVPRAFFER